MSSVYQPARYLSYPVGNTPPPPSPYTRTKMKIDHDVHTSAIDLDNYVKTPTLTYRLFLHRSKVLRLSITSSSRLTTPLHHYPGSTWVIITPAHFRHFSPSVTLVMTASWVLYATVPKYCSSRGATRTYLQEFGVPPLALLISGSDWNGEDRGREFKGPRAWVFLQDSHAYPLWQK